MRASSRILVVLTVLAALCLGGPSWAEGPAPGVSEKRIALVVGNAAYQAGGLATPANDAGLVAQTLQAAGFDVVGARDLDEDLLRRAMRDFTDKAAASGPDTVAFVYLAGYGLQLNGENYFAPIDATIESAADVPVRAMRISDYKRQLASLPLKARFVVLDAARNAPFVKRGDPLAGGLALTEAEPGSLVAFNAAPGTVGPEEKGPYGAYAQALVEMIREGGLAPDQLFDRVRLRVSETTQGGEVPWNASKLDAPFVFFQRAADAPPVAEPDKVSALESRPLRELPVKDAYATCLKRDTVQGYQDFVTAFPKDPMTKRVRALAAARREAVTWRRTFVADNPDAYWSYLSRYPRGPHAYDCRRRLRELSVALEPPARFTALDYDLPPPPPEEIVYVERPVVYFADPVYDLPPPPPPPVFFLPPQPAYIVDLAPPPPIYEVYALPVPAFVPVPLYVSAPAYIAAPPNNVYYQNIHNTTVINEINRYNAAPRDARPRVPAALAVGAGAVGGAALGAAATRVALPPALANKAALGGNGPADVKAGPGNPVRSDTPGLRGPLPNGQQVGPQQANRPGQPTLGQDGQPVPGGKPALGKPALGQPLPGQDGQPLPQQAKPVRPVLGPNGKPLQQEAVRPGDRTPPPVGPNGKPLPQPGTAAQRGPNTPDQADKPGPKDRFSPQQAGRVDPALRPETPNGKPGSGPGTPASPGASETRPRTPPIRLGNPDPRQPGADRLRALREQRQQPGQAAAQRQAEQAQRQQASQAAAQRQQQAAQAAQQRAGAQQQQAAQARAAAQQQASQQRQMMQQQQAVQQRAAAQQQAAQERQMMQQQQAAQQRQMMQQQASQQRQMQAPRQQPSGGGHPCRPGMPCR